MKVYSISVFNSSDIKQVHDLSSFGYFSRSTIANLIQFTSKITAERTENGQFLCIPSEKGIPEAMVYSYRNNDMTVVVITDNEYPSSAARRIINKVIVDQPELSEMLKEDPLKVDPLLKVKGDLDETKVILMKTMEEILRRGEKLDDLITRSEQLTASSKLFYRQARKTNSCCTIQ